MIACGGRGGGGSELKQAQTHGRREQTRARPKSWPRLLLLGQNIEISLFLQVVF
jgi:hypothetical protein